MTEAIKLKSEDLLGKRKSAENILNTIKYPKKSDAGWGAN